MKGFLIGLSTLLAATTSFAVDLNADHVGDLIDSKLLDKVRVELDQQLTIVYRVKTDTQKELKNGDLTSTTTNDFIVRKIDLNTKGKIVNYGYGYVSVSFEKGCEIEKCLYKFENIDGHYELMSVPRISGYQFVSANSGILPFTNAFKAIDKVNLVINKKEVLKINKTIENLGGYDSEN